MIDFSKSVCWKRFPFAFRKLRSMFFWENPNDPDWLRRINPLNPGMWPWWRRDIELQFRIKSAMACSATTPKSFDLRTCSTNELQPGGPKNAATDRVIIVERDFQIYFKTAVRALKKSPHILGATTWNSRVLRRLLHFIAVQHSSYSPTQPEELCFQLVKWQSGAA